MTEAIAITLELEKDLFDHVQQHAEASEVSWQESLASLVEAGLNLAQKGKALEAYDVTRCYAWLGSQTQP